MPLRSTLSLFALAFALLLPGCQYTQDRALDLTDMVDLKFSNPVGGSMGLGAKLEATQCLGAGLGIGKYGPTCEWYGRGHQYAEDQCFLHLYYLGWDGMDGARNHITNSVNVIGINALPLVAWLLEHPPAHEQPGYPFLEGNPQWISQFRFGGEVLLPFVNFGIYGNVGEVFDFVFGLATIDISDDDGKSKTTTYLEEWKAENR